MVKIEMLGDNLLLVKQEPKRASEFETGGDEQPHAPLYMVHFAGPDAPVKQDDVVILKPGAYENNVIDGITYLFAEGPQIAGKVDL